MLAFTRDALVACGVPDADAAVAAKQMIEADLTGFDAHGIFRLAPYCKTLKTGRVKAKADIKVLQRSPATALVDGDDGIGHLVMTYAANLAMELARQSGVGWVGVRNSNHAGAAGIYAEMCAAQGMVGIYAAVSTVNHMGPWGGAEPMIGTNPIAIGIPAGKEAPVVLDIATSVSSFGTIRQHMVTGKPLEEGWVVHSKTGEPILDPKKVARRRAAADRRPQGRGPRADDRPARGRRERRGFRPRRGRCDGTGHRSRPTPGSSSLRSMCRASSSRGRSRPRWTAISASFATRRSFRASTGSGCRARTAAIAAPSAAPMAWCCPRR